MAVKRKTHEALIAVRRLGSFRQFAFRRTLLWTAHSRHRHQLLARHPQARQRTELPRRGVLRQFAESHLHEPDLTFDHSKRVFNLRTKALRSFFLIRSLALHSRRLARSLGLGAIRHRRSSRSARLSAPGSPSRPAPVLPCRVAGRPLAPRLLRWPP